MMIPLKLCHCSRGNVTLTALAETQVPLSYCPHVTRHLGWPPAVYQFSLAETAVRFRVEELIEASFGLCG